MRGWVTLPAERAVLALGILGTTRLPVVDVIPSPPAWNPPLLEGVEALPKFPTDHVFIVDAERLTPSQFAAVKEQLTRLYGNAEAEWTFNAWGCTAVPS